MKRMYLRRLPSIIAVAGAATLLFLALPRTVSSIAVELTTPTYKNRNNPNVAETDLLRAVDDLKSANDWEETPETYSKLGDLYLAIAQRQMDPKHKLDFYYLAEDSYTRAVSGSPLDPYYWLRLTRARMLSGGKEDGSAAESLKMSILTGPNEQALAVLQIHFAASIWDQFDVDAKQSILEKVRWAAQHDMDKLVETAKSNNKFLELVLTGLAGSDIQTFTNFVNRLSQN